MEWQEDYKRKVVSKEEMAKQIKSGDFIMTALGLGSCTPGMIHAILDRAKSSKASRSAMPSPCTRPRCLILIS